MSSDHTQYQSEEARQRASQLSERRTRPPTDVPGYEPLRFLGAGAYGEVWVAVDQNTGRQVAIKFYAHRGGVDWSLLSREVEKLVFLSADRYVVQLLDVGWDADPPYYVMEYIENGSLDDLLREAGTLTVREAVEIFRDVATGLSHAHTKGVLHCDLKPANVLLDQDHKPRLADFGQSRLSYEQTPALGTLFYMAPEQADLEAVPDARWDVYALGAILYCMITGEPPFRTTEALSQIDASGDLTNRLLKYRTIIRKSPRPVAHRRVPGMDRALAEIIDRCLTVDPERRYPTVQSVLQALERRQLSHVRRPLLVLGVAGPLLLLATMGFFGYRAYRNAMRETEDVVTSRARESNQFAAQFVAETVADEIDHRYQAVEKVANDPEFQQLMRDALGDQQLREQLAVLDAPATSAKSNAEVPQVFLDNAARQKLQDYLQRTLANPALPKAASWFVTDSSGTFMASVFAKDATSVTGQNFARRTYFHGGPRDLALDARPKPLQETTLSPVFKSTAANTWKVAISTPVIIDGMTVGVVALTVENGGLAQFSQSDTEPDAWFAVLVDGRRMQNRGAILEHPLFDKLLKEQDQLPERLGKIMLDVDQFDGNDSPVITDPLSTDELGAEYRGRWVAGTAAVPGTESKYVDDGQDKNNGTVNSLIVLVQQQYDKATEPVRDLGRRLLREGLSAFAVTLLVMFVLWYFVVRLRRNVYAGRRASAIPTERSTPMHNRETMEAPSP
ncbi:MAG: protein kinase [Pirellulaceae bacterium]|nr:protein kinase [Planctomycetales bacterium]